MDRRAVQAWQALAVLDADLAVGVLLACFEDRGIAVVLLAGRRSYEWISMASMIQFGVIGSAVLVCCASVFCVSCGTPSNTAADAEAVKAQIAKYTAAVDAADPALGGQVWLNSPDVSFIWPVGHAHGWEEVKKVYAFFEAGFTDRKLTAHDIAVHVYKDSAWAEFYWHFTAKQKSNGMDIVSDGRESQVYQKLDGAWRLVHAHYSGPAMAMPPAP